MVGLYNAGLINRGSVTIWIDEAVLARIPDAIPTRGRPCLYGDALIQALLGVKTVYRLTLRALQGFTQSLRDLAFQSLLCRITPRSVAGQKRLMSNCRSFATTNQIHLVVDSTGLKICGEGEWKVASAATRSGARGVKSISRSMRIRVKCMPC
ncbi:MAG: transposase [Burkholderia sp.]